MAQIGSFIPATKANIGIIDRLFTRVGASDNLAGGESTFMVEMNETANILNNATKRSLVLLDEIGRGTSTFDGLSLAWAITEYLHNDSFSPLTMFATHYHELVELANKLTKAFNLTVNIREYNDKIIFLRKIINGAASKSYGIHVAEMAGIPKKVINRSKKILNTLSSTNNNPLTLSDNHNEIKNNDKDKKEENIKNDLEKIDLNNITPIDAIKELNNIKDKYEIN